MIRTSVVVGAVGGLALVAGCSPGAEKSEP